MKSCVIFNPAAGRGRAARWQDQLRLRVPADTEFLPTTHIGHAEDLAREAAPRYDRIIAAGGDGTVHEVANGVLKANGASPMFSVVPIGSANDYAHSLGILNWWNTGRNWDELRTQAVDVGEIRQAGRKRFFLNGCGIGFNGYVSQEARGIRWLRGIPLYTLAVLKTLLHHFHAPECIVSRDHVEIRQPALVLSFAIGQREGGFPLALNAKVDDGLFDWLRVGSVSRWELVRHLPSMMTGKLPQHHPHLNQGRCRNASIQCADPLCIHLDGEMYALPADRIHQVELECLSKRLNVEVWNPPES